MNDMAKNLVLWVIIALVLMMVFKNFGNPVMSGEISYSRFISDVKTGRIVEVNIEGSSITGRLSDGNRFTTYSPETSYDYLIGTLLENNVEIKGMEPNKNSFWAHALISWFPILLLLGIWIYFMRQMQGGGGGRGALSFGKSRARLLGEDQIKITFSDVAGVEEAKEEVGELVEFLRDPGKFQKLGGKIPSGVLMVGAPGTGKTLLAKAIAGEARCLSLPYPVLTLLKCLLVSVHPVFAICLSKPRNTRRVLSLSMRSMPLVDIAVLVWVAVMMSVSKH